MQKKPAAQGAGFFCIERHHPVIGQQGERFLFYRLETLEDDREAIADVTSRGPFVQLWVEFRICGAEGQSRTADTLIFSQVLYHLSYLGTLGGAAQF